MYQDSLLDKIKKLFIYLFRLYGLYILFFICVAILQSIFPYLDLKKYSQDAIFDIIKDNKLNAFLTIVVQAPILEELMFRTLLKPKTKELLLFLSTWTIFILGLFIKLDVVWYYNHIILIASVIGFFFIYKHSISIKIIEVCENFLHKHTIITLQLTAIVFGFLHVFNYTSSLTMNSVLFLLIVPRIIAGHMFGRLKLENNHLVWPIALHALNNGVVFLIIIRQI